MLISICIPTYARFACLQKAVYSALWQTYPEIEICISQDPGSNGPDSTINKWCLEQVAKYPSIKYNLNDSNLGIAGNWNRLVKMAIGDYIIIIGDDDILSRNFIKKLHTKIVGYNIDVVFSNQYFINEKGKILYQYTEESNKKYGRDELCTGKIQHPIATVLKNSVPISASLIKRNYLLKYPYDPTLNTPELEVFLKIAISGGNFAYINEKLAYYRIHSQSATSKGLLANKFLKNLIDIEVPPEYEHLKYKIISFAVIPSVNMSLIQGDKKLALQLLGSSYYPSKWHIKLLQYILLVFPTWFTKKLIS